MHVSREKWNYLATSDKANHPWRATLRAMWPIILMQHVCVYNIKTYENYNDFGDHLPIWINFKMITPIVIFDPGNHFQFTNAETLRQLCRIL
jgi:hypothetical protein